MVANEKSRIAMPQYVHSIVRMCAICILLANSLWAESYIEVMLEGPCFDTNAPLYTQTGSVYCEAEGECDNGITPFRYVSIGWVCSDNAIQAEAEAKEVHQLIIEDNGRAYISIGGIVCSIYGWADCDGNDSGTQTCAFAC